MKKILVSILVITTVIAFIWGINFSYPHPSTHEIDGFDYFEQPDGITCGPTSVLMLLHRYGKNVTLDEVKSQTKTQWFKYNDDPIGMTSPDCIVPAMNHFGVGSRLLRGDLDRLKYFVSKNRPAIVLLRSGQQTWHYVVVIGYTENKIIVADPGPGARKEMSVENFLGAWDFTHDMYGESTQTKCNTCGGTGRWVQSINLGPFSYCEICSGTGKSPDMLIELLRMAEVNTRTMIVPSIHIEASNLLKHKGG